MAKLTRIFYFFFWLLLGILVGTMVSGICAKFPALSWLAYSETLTFTPAFDIVLLKMNLSLSMTLNLAQAIFVAGAMFIYYHFWY